MKYLITVAWEIEGHAGASSFITDSLKNVDKFICDCLKDEDGNLIGQIKDPVLSEDKQTATYYGHWECGDMAISVRKFKAFSNMLNKESFTRTG